MNRSLAVFLALLLLVSGMAACFSAEPKSGTTGKAAKVEWHTDLKAAHKSAVARKRPLLIVVGGPSCGYCKLLEKNTLNATEVSELIGRKFVAVHLDVEKDRKVCEALDIEGLPTTLVITPDAEVLAEQVGYVKKSEFCKLLNEALDVQKELQTASAE